ncbi:MAG: glycosyltransferase [Aerococcaceae bacterium]|nr:glycosyltransferase [Aerococcaceae bacterium]
MKKICFAFNNLQFSDGISRSVIGIANALALRNDVEVTLRPLFICDKSVLPLLSEKIKVKPLFRFYFRGLSQLIYRLPKRLLYRMIFKESYDIEVGFQYFIATKAVASSDRQAKHYIWMHGYDEGLLMKEHYLKADKVMCVSKYNANRLTHKLEGRVPVQVCYNPIDDESIRQQAAQQPPMKRPEVPLLVTVGRLSPEKGFVRLIKVLARLRQEKYAFHLWLIGNGPEREHLEALIQEGALTENVTLLGEQSNPHQYTAQADIFVCASFAEGYSTACCEASILGVPVISTDVSGAREIIADAQAGLVVDLDDDSLYDGLKRVLNTPELITQWKHTLQASRQNFYYENRIAQLYQVLELEE